MGRELTRLEQLSILSDRLNALMEDPEPGLSTWWDAVHAVVKEIGVWDTGR